MVTCCSQMRYPRCGDHRHSSSELTFPPLENVPSVCHFPRNAQLFHRGINSSLLRGNSNAHQGGTQQRDNKFPLTKHCTLLLFHPYNHKKRVAAMDGYCRDLRLSGTRSPVKAQRCRIKLHALTKAQSAVDFNSACVVRPDCKKWSFTMVKDALGQLPDQRRSVAAAGLSRTSGHRADLPVSRTMQSQTCHGHNLAFTLDSHKASQHVQALRKRATRTCGLIQACHLRQVRWSQIFNLAATQVGPPALAQP